MSQRRTAYAGLEAERTFIRELVAWARAGFDQSFTPGRHHGLPLRSTAEAEVAAGRLSRFDHLLFLLALCHRTGVNLAAHVSGAVPGAAALARLDPALGAVDARMLDDVLCQAEVIPELSGLRAAVSAAVGRVQAAAAEREREQARQARIAARAQFLNTVNRITSLVQSAIPVVYTPDPLNLDDVRVALAWTLRTSVANAARQAPDVYAAITRFSGNAHFRRNLSARAAERAAAQFYVRLGLSVQDVAGNDSSDEWKSHDLLAGGRAIDVKNVRWTRRTHLIEEARVTAFKHTAAGAPVVVAGTRSAALPPRVLVDPSADSAYLGVEFLGEISEQRFLALVEEFGKGPLEMDFSRPGEPDEPVEQYLPHWMFDYPAPFYAGRNEAAALVHPKLFRDRWFWIDARLHPLAFVLVSGSGLEPAADVRAARWEWNLLDTLLQRRARFADPAAPGMSLAVLYLSLLEHFLPLASSFSTPQEFSPGGYRRLIFLDDSPEMQRWPAGVYDPHETIATLIGHLQAMWNARAELRGLRQFRLSGRDVLQGRPRPGERWTTLVAYCGDCRFPSLVLGKNASCPHCRKLVCRQCNFCSPPLRNGAAETWPPPARSCQGGPRHHPRSQ